MIVYVKPHSLETESLEATARAIEGLPGYHRCSRNEEGSLYLENGCLVVHSANPDFLVFAVMEQGYGSESSKQLEADRAPQYDLWSESDLRSEIDRRKLLHGVGSQGVFVDPQVRHARLVEILRGNDSLQCYLEEVARK